MPETDALRLDALRKDYKGFTALDGVSLTVRKGEFLTVLGPSGSGKSTILSLIAGLAHPDSGRILIGGRDATELPTHKRGIGVVFQNYALFPHLSVFQNIAFPLEQRGIRGDELRRKVENICRRVGLESLMARKPDALSGGQRQRVALARCLVYTPAIILMDEPLAALDKKMRNQLQEEIRALHRDLGTTLIYVTHDQHEALTMSDRICLMNHGRIEQLALPRTLYTAPETVFAAQFIGDSNILYGTSPALDAEGRVGAILAGGVPCVAAARPGRGASTVAFLVRPENITLYQGARTTPVISRRADRDLRNTGAGEAQPLYDEADVSGPNHVKGTITDIVFSGSITRYRLTTPGFDLLVDEVTRSGEPGWVLGQTVIASWREEDCIALGSGALPSETHSPMAPAMAVAPPEAVVPGAFP